MTSHSDEAFFRNIEAIGLKQEIECKKDVLIKINLSGTYIQGHPRTDMNRLRMIVSYIYQNGGRCAIAEGAHGRLSDNLTASGFEDMQKKYGIKVIDIDSEECDDVISYDEHHYIPKCFRDYPIRIAMPSTSKRKDMVFSNNIKLFVGAVPRKLYQLDGEEIGMGVPRPRIHRDLHVSVANLFLAIDRYSPFQYYINGGLCYNENRGEFMFPETYIGNDAYELDCHIFLKYFNDCEYPDYLDILKARRLDRNAER